MELLEKHLDTTFNDIKVPIILRDKKGDAIYDYDMTRGQNRTRVLRAIADKEGKTRVMAIGDY
jgi:hypothetical protein